MTHPHLLTRIHTLCSAFSNPETPLPTLLSNFTSSDPWAHEHGLPQLAPFLGRTFRGMQGLETYFTRLAEMLEIEWMRFEGEGGWVVDERSGRIEGEGEGYGSGSGDGEGGDGGQGEGKGEEMKVSLRGEARFRWKSTGQAWEEGFAYRIGLVHEGGEVKVKSYEVWADTGALYLARKGELDALT